MSQDTSRGATRAGSSHPKRPRACAAEAGVPQYWIARPATRDVLMCSQPDPGLGDYAQSRLVGRDEELVSPSLPVRPRAGDLFEGAPDTTL